MPKIEEIGEEVIIGEHPSPQTPHAELFDSYLGVEFSKA